MTTTDFENDELMLVHDEDEELPSGEDYSAHMPPIPVKAEGQDHPGGHQGIHFTASISASNPVVQLLGRDYDRLEARIISTGISSATTQVSQVSTPSAVTSATAGQVLTSLTGTGAGAYTVNWEVMERGTLAAQDANNFGLYMNSTLIATSVNALNVGSVYPQLAATVIAPAGATFEITAVGAASSGTVYQAQMAIQLAAVSVSPGPVVLAQTREIAEMAYQAGANFSGPSGAYLPAGLERVLRNCDEVWAAYLGSPTLLAVSVSRRLDNVNQPHS